MAQHKPASYLGICITLLFLALAGCANSDKVISRSPFAVDNPILESRVTEVFPQEIGVSGMQRVLFESVWPDRSGNLHTTKREVPISLGLVKGNRVLIRDFYRRRADGKGYESTPISIVYLDPLYTPPERQQEVLGLEEMDTDAYAVDDPFLDCYVESVTPKPLDLTEQVLATLRPIFPTRNGERKARFINAPQSLGMAERHPMTVRSYYLANPNDTYSYESTAIHLVSPNYLFRNRSPEPEDEPEPEVSVAETTQSAG